LSVSLVLTILNEAGNLDELLAGIQQQSVQPDEIVIVDGGSSDGTLERLQDWASKSETRVTVESVPGVNIARGRNLAIAKATGNIIAVTDGGCVAEKQWLQQITEPFQAGDVHVVMGFYRADTRGLFETTLCCLNMPEPDEIKEDKFMPSSRSIAFFKQTWAAAGKYPEWLDIGEDMFFNFTCRALKTRRRYAPEAVVHWRPRSGLKATLKQYREYARGDALGGMYLQRHALRFFTYAAFLGMIGVWLVAPVWLLVPLLAEVVWIFPALRRAARRVRLPGLFIAVPLLLVLQVLVDLSKLAGYLKGLFGPKSYKKSLTSASSDQGEADTD